MISSRLPRDLSPNAITRLLDELRRAGTDICDLTESNPTRVGLTYPPHLLDALATADSLDYDPQPLGMSSAREAVARDFARRGLRVDADRIALAASTSEAYAWLFKLLCDAGDSVLVPRPSYPLFAHLTTLESVRAVPYRLEYHGMWRLDVEHLHHVVEARSRALVIVAPNNPTGSFLHEADLIAVAELCASRNMALIGDEVFADYALDAAPDAAPVLTAEGIVVCSLGGLSKSIGLPQLKLGWIGFGGPPSLLPRVMNSLEMLADTYLSVSTPVQVALPSLFVHGRTVCHQLRQRTARNLAALRAAATERPSVTVLRVEGGWTAVLQVPAYRSEERLILELLAEDHVLVHPGFFFDFDREAYVVVSLIVEPATFDRGVARLLARISAAV